MPIMDEIYAAADNEGVGLAEYIRKTYSKKSLDKLERNVRLQLDSLQGEIAGFMNGVGVPEIEENLMTATSDKLDIMQSRVRVSLASKITELDELLSSSGAEGLTEESQAVSGGYVFA